MSRTNYPQKRETALRETYIGSDYPLAPIEALARFSALSKSSCASLKSRDASSFKEYPCLE